MLFFKLTLSGLLISSLSCCAGMSVPWLSQIKEFTHDPAFYELSKDFYYIEKISSNTGKDSEILFPDGANIAIKKAVNLRIKLLLL